MSSHPLTSPVHRLQARRPPLAIAAAAASDDLLNWIESLLEPTIQLVVLFTAAFFLEGRVRGAYLVLGGFCFALTYPCPRRLSARPWFAALGIALKWTLLVGLIWIFLNATGYITHYSTRTLFVWALGTPLLQIGAHFLLRRTAPRVLALDGGLRPAVIVGMNEQGIALARRARSTPYARVQLRGFFDDRGDARLDFSHGLPLLGRLSDLPRYVKTHGIQSIYLSLPMASQPRILALLDELRDTTASIYFVPDLFVTDLIQSRASSIGDVPVVAVCETPFIGINGLLKRLIDIVISVTALLLCLPLMLLIAVIIRLISPGPVIFRQHRYGLDGVEIVVYKFRTMTVCEDGDVIPQATQGDARVTRLGRWLRRTSLDELPQFINVLQGRMSVVGPRPHAVAHNEVYRKLIKGYMIRHKVKPGITGWAQVNGLRGETENLDKMRTRIEYDLDYLRNWSLALDFLIIARTVGLVIKDGCAY